MPKQVKRVRPYRSPLRDQRARDTGNAICEAALQLFVRDGYAATTIAAIAAAAGVSSETVYARFGNKRDLLRAVFEYAVPWEEASTGLLDVDWVARVRALPDPRRRLASMAKRTRGAQERAAALGDMLHIAARGDAELANLEAEIDTRRRRDVEALVEILAEDVPLRLEKRHAADVLWAIAVSDLYVRLRKGCEWSERKTADFIQDLIERTLLD